MSLSPGVSFWCPEAIVREWANVDLEGPSEVCCDGIGHGGAWRLGLLKIAASIQIKPVQCPPVHLFWDSGWFPQHSIPSSPAGRRAARRVKQQQQPVPGTSVALAVGKPPQELSAPEVQLPQQFSDSSQLPAKPMAHKFTCHLPAWGCTLPSPGVDGPQHAGACLASWVRSSLQWWPLVYNHFTHQPNAVRDPAGASPQCLTWGRNLHFVSSWRGKAGRWMTHTTASTNSLVTRYTKQQFTLDWRNDYCWLKDPSWSLMLTGWYIKRRTYAVIGHWDHY